MQPFYLAMDKADIVIRTAFSEGVDITPTLSNPLTMNADCGVLSNDSNPQ